ncbi:MAG: hypothetical protein ABIO04_00760 [Ferruginibacter sp.]
MDTLVAVDRSAVNRQRKELMYTSFATNIPKGKIDSVNSYQVIDGISFDKYKITVTVDQKVLFNSFLLTTIYKGYALGISYVCMDDKTRREIENMLRRFLYLNKVICCNKQLKNKELVRQPNHKQ